MVRQARQREHLQRLAARLEPAHFEDPRFQDLLERARRDTAGNFGQFVTLVLGACTESVRVASLTAVLVFIEPVVALAGENGAGKTTLAKLLARLYEPGRGSILLGGVDIGAWPPEQTHREVAFLFQDAGRYEATVADDIAYGDWDRLREDAAAVATAARRVGLHTVVSGMPQGYQTLLGRMFGEYAPSGGQWQQIALARTFSREAALLVLDEPTLHLDHQAERFFLSDLRALCAGRTVVLITHHPPLLALADRVLLLRGGLVAEQGRHDELLARAGAYAALFGGGAGTAASPVVAASGVFPGDRA